MLRHMIIRNDADIGDGLTALIALDPRLEAVAEAAGPLPLRLSEPGFAGLAHIVVSQMVSRQSADAIWERMLAAMGSVDADALLRLEDGRLATLGLSRAKLACLLHVARRVVDGDLDLVGLAGLPTEQALAQLIGLPGIGPWTAEVYLMFCGGHSDIFPAGDVALRAAVGEAFEFDVRPDIATVAALALAWRPWRSVAARLFWAYYAARRGRSGMPGSQ